MQKINISTIYNVPKEICYLYFYNYEIEQQIEYLVSVDLGPAYPIVGFHYKNYVDTFPLRNSLDDFIIQTKESSKRTNHSKTLLSMIKIFYKANKNVQNAKRNTPSI